MDPVEQIKQNFDESIRLKQESAELLAHKIREAAILMTNAILQESKILSCGNGGSAADSQRFSSELLNRFEMERSGLPAFALKTNSSTLTSIANEYQFADIFSKQIKAFDQPGDILQALTISGKSHNIIHAIDAAYDRDMTVIALTGREDRRVAYFM